MSKTLEVRVYDAQELKAEAIRRWPTKGMQVPPNVLLDELMAVASVVRNGLFILMGTDEWGDNSPLKSIMDFLNYYYESDDAEAVFEFAQVDWRYTPVSLEDLCNRVGISVEDLTKPKGVPDVPQDKETPKKTTAKKTTKK